MMNSCPVSRREFLGGTITVATAWTAATEPLDFPIVDLHVHLDNSSIEQVLPLARRAPRAVRDRRACRDEREPVSGGPEHRRGAEHLPQAARGQGRVPGGAGRVDRLDVLLLARGACPARLRAHRRHDFPGAEWPPGQALGARRARVGGHEQPRATSWTASWTGTSRSWPPSRSTSWPMPPGFPTR